jgi:hypothetical protein
MPPFVLKFRCLNLAPCKNHCGSTDELFMSFQHHFVGLDENTIYVGCQFFSWSLSKSNGLKMLFDLVVLATIFFQLTLVFYVV